MSAAERLAALDDLSAADLCQNAETTLQGLVEIMNQETTLLRAGHFREAALLTAQKTQLAQDYVSVSRTIQRQLERIKRDALPDLERLQHGHERLATQMAENLRVIATARDVTQDLLTDVTNAVGRQNQPTTYGATGSLKSNIKPAAGGIAINRAL